MPAIILICGEGEWAEGVTKRLSVRGPHVLRARTMRDLQMLVDIKPELIVLGPPFTQQEVVESFVEIRDRGCESRVLVAVDRDDAAFARDLEVLGVQRMVLVPSQAEAVIQEAAAFA